MRKSIKVTTLAALAAFALAALSSSALAADKDESYSLGYKMGTDLTPVKETIDFDSFIEGMTDSINGKEGKIAAAERAKLIESLKAKIIKIQTEERTKASAGNKEKADKFLADNAKKEGVVKLPSGLQYKVVKEGEGEAPKAESSVTVHYVGTLVDGTEFDSSRKRNQPASFKLNQVIKGWTEGLQLMKPGATYIFYIPPELGYGDRGAGKLIGPNEALIFEVELIKVGDK